MGMSKFFVVMVLVLVLLSNLSTQKTRAAEGRILSSPSSSSLPSSSQQSKDSLSNSSMSEILIYGY